jgi:hypothetical protein
LAIRDLRTFDLVVTLLEVRGEFLCHWFQVADGDGY